MVLELYSEEDDRFYELEFANVDNGGKYPGSFTKKEYDWISEYSIGTVLHLFSGSSVFGDIRVDLANPNATINDDVFHFLESFHDSVDTIVLDPPYNKKFAEKYAKLANCSLTQQFIIFAQAAKTTELWHRLQHLQPKRIILKSWNWYLVQGYHKLQCFLCYAGGYRKPTLFMVMEKD